MVVVLAGGTGGAKLARGLLDVVGPAELTVVANTADDAELYGVHVSPDPDLVTYWLADLIDERGWGIAGDTWHVMDALAAAGEPAWFRLGDQDLAMCLLRTQRLRAGERLTDAHAAVVRGVRVEARVLPMCDEPVATWVQTAGAWLPFQQFMILERGAEPEAVELRGIEAARPTADVLDAIERADAIVIGPSNPVISIGPILAVPGLHDALAAARAPVVAVSPFVRGAVVKGPTEAFCRLAGLPLGVAAVEQAYAGLVDGVVADERAGSLPTLEADVLMDTPDARARVARETLTFAQTLE
ncbi:MAG: 2-phospho-L-lactate transferase [Thermoleophilaceae bacterium]